MHKRLTPLVVFLCFEICSMRSLAQLGEHTADIIYFKNCQGVPTVAKLEGNLFRIRKSFSPVEVWEDKPVAEVCYQTWDNGGNWFASLHDQPDNSKPSSCQQVKKRTTPLKRQTTKKTTVRYHKEFCHVRADGKERHPELFIRYINNTGAEWTAYVAGHNTFQHIPKVPPTPADAQQLGDIDKHIEFALHDGHSPAADCPAHPGCCALIYRVEPRSWIAEEAVAVAHKGICDSAVHILTQTQCHNPDAAILLESHADDTCAELKKH